jgi:hypothetical protein
MEELRAFLSPVPPLQEVTADIQDEVDARAPRELAILRPRE